MQAPFTCKYCGRPSWIDPSDQSPPPDYCHDHGTAEDRTCITYTIATMNDIIIAAVPDGGDIYAAVADAAARSDVDIDFRDIDVTEGVTLTDDTDDDD